MQYILLTFLCAITLIAYVQRSAMNGATKAIENDLQLSSQDLGWVMSGWYLLYSLVQLPGGWVADRLGSKPALILFAVSWSVLTGLAGLASGFPSLVLLWALMGAAQAGIFPCCTKAIGAAFPPAQQAFASGALACSMALGGALAPAMTGQLLRTLSWQAIFALYAAPGLIWAILFARTFQNPDTIPAQSSGAKGDPPRVASDLHEPIRWTKLVTDPQMLLLCFQQFLRAGAMVFFYTWFARFLQETRGLSEQQAGSLAFWPPFAGALGGLSGGLLSDWLLRRTGHPRLARQGMTFVALCSCTGLAAATYFVADPYLAVLLISLGAFCGMASGVSAYALAIAYGGKQVATVFATMNMSGNFGATLFPSLVAVLVIHTGNWNSALMVFVGLFAAAALCWLFLNPQDTLFQEPLLNSEQIRYGGG